jgi:hypothetical protein
MLGKLRMTVEEAKVAYEMLSADMFAKQQKFRFLEQGRLDDKVFTSAIRSVIQRKLGDADAKLCSPEKRACKMYVSRGVMIPNCFNMTG